MNKSKKIFTSILIVLVFLCLFIPKSNANFFTDDWDGSEQKSEIETAIDEDSGGIFEKIIAKMIGGIAESVFSITTSEELGVGFKNYDELIFATNSTAISPFTEEQWSLMMKWYRVMSLIAGSLILIVVVVVAYKFIVSGFSIDKRNEAKDSLLRLFFGAASIGFAPIFVKFLLFLNNNLVHMIIGYSNTSLDSLLGNSILTNIRTGNAIATAIVIALFAYLFFKVNVKFIIRQFTILIFTLFTPIVSIMWMINKRAIGASLWFGQILINVFMQFIYAFLFLIYMQFLPESGGWATSLLWAMMILPIADVLQNTLQNLISRIAGINNDELANRGIGMAGAMAHSVRSIAYQFKNPDAQNNLSNNTSGFGRMFNKESVVTNEKVTEVPKNEMQVSPMKVNSINTTNTPDSDIKQKSNFNNIAEGSKKAINIGKEFTNMGMYVAEGRNFNPNKNFNSGRNFERYNINNTRKEDISKKNKTDSVIINIEENDKYDS